MIPALLFSVMATFASPEYISSGPASLLFALPLIAIISIVYKATKVKQIKPASFIKQSAILFGSITIFMIMTALGLYLVIKLVIG